MRGDGLYLVDILEAAASVRRFIEGIDEAEFASSDLIHSAVLQKLIVVGEAASCISQATRDANPDVPWPLVRAFRNFAVHVYFAIKWNKVWDIAQNELPLLALQIEDILRVDYPEIHAEYVRRLSEPQ